MDLNEYYSSKWQIHVITTVEKLSKQLKSKNLIGKSIKQIFNVGVIFNEDDKEKVYIELDEPIIFILEDTQLEILAIDGSAFVITYDTLSLQEVSYKRKSCNSVEKYLTKILNKQIIEVEVIANNECNFTGSFGLELPEQEEYIDEIVIKVKSGKTLHITAWFDYMHLYIKDKQSNILYLD